MSLRGEARNLRLRAEVATRFRRFSAKLVQVRWAELMARATGTLSSGQAVHLPRSVIVRITERCFLRCRMCGQNGPRGRLRNVRPSQREVFDRETLFRVLEELGRWPVKPFLKLTGGEPLVETDLTLSVLEKASDLGLVSKLNTNGVLLSDRAVARRVVRSGLDYLSVSIDGPADVHDRIRGRSGVYDAALQGIRNVRELRRTEARRPLMILVSAIVSALNQDRLLETARLMDAARVDWLNFEFMNFITPALSASARTCIQRLFGISEAPWASFANTELADVSSAALAGEIRAIRRGRFAMPISFLGIGDLSAVNIADYFHHIDQPLRTRQCEIPRTAAFLIPPRAMAFCVDYPFYHYADLAEGSVAAGWFGKKAQAFRRAMAGHYRKTRSNFPQCQRCNWRFN